VVTTAENSTPIKLRAIIVGSSLKWAEIRGVAPILSPAETTIVFGLLDLSSFM